MDINRQYLSRKFGLPRKIYLGGSIEFYYEYPTDYDEVTINFTPHKTENPEVEVIINDFSIEIKDKTELESLMKIIFK